MNSLNNSIGSFTSNQSQNSVRRIGQLNQNNTQNIISRSSIGSFTSNQSQNSVHQVNRPSRYAFINEDSDENQRIENQSNLSNDQLLKSLLQRVERLEQNQEEIPKLFSKFSALTSKVDNMGQTLQDLNDKFALLDTKLGDKIKDLKKNVNAVLAENFDSFNAKLEALETDFTTKLEKLTVIQPKKLEESKQQNTIPKHKCFYDYKGFLTKMEYYYNKEKDLQQMELYSNGKMQTVNNYNTDGNPQTKETYQSNGNLETKETYQSNGTALSTRETYQSNGKLKTKETFTYDSFGTLTKTETYDSNEKLKTIKTYQSKGKCIHEVYSYNLNEKLTTKEIYDKDGKLETKEIYDKNGKLEKTRSFYCVWDDIESTLNYQSD